VRQVNLQASDEHRCARETREDAAGLSRLDPAADVSDDGQPEKQDSSKNEKAVGL